MSTLLSLFCQFHGGSRNARLASTIKWQSDKSVAQKGTLISRLARACAAAASGSVAGIERARKLPPNRASVIVLVVSFARWHIVVAGCSSGNTAVAGAFRERTCMEIPAARVRERTAMLAAPALISSELPAVLSDLGEQDAGVR
jgi:hypothetical protein